MPFMARPFIFWEGAVKESVFQAHLIKELKERLPGCIVMKNDAGHNQGIPDISVLFGPFYGLLECKRSIDAPHRPNQDYYVDSVNHMGGFARFVCPENKEAVLDELESALRSCGEACVSEPK